MGDLPVIDVEALVRGVGDGPAVGRLIDAACRDVGFFSIVGHGIDLDRTARLERAARAFFALDEAEKAEVAMAAGGRAWRGWFPVGGELTSGRPDGKEGFYFGQELGADHPKVRAGVVLHGPNLFPRRPASLRPLVLEHLAAMTGLGHALLRGIAFGLGLDGEWFARHLTADPLVLFRIFHYPAASTGEGGPGWGVGEHTDYGLLTILGQDRTGGLEVRTPSGWVDVAPLEGALVCNLGDMLERMTGGAYRSTPHRVRPPTTSGRVSLPFFFDPGWDAEVRPVPMVAAERRADLDGERWDGADVHGFHGTYGDYVSAKVARVFPDLAAATVTSEPPAR